MNEFTSNVTNKFGQRVVNMKAPIYVTRSIYPEVPPRVEHALTERTESLLPHIKALIGWALENMEAIMNDRKAKAGCK